MHMVVIIITGMVIIIIIRTGVITIRTGDIIIRITDLMVGVIILITTILTGGAMAHTIMDTILTVIITITALIIKQLSITDVRVFFEGADIIGKPLIFYNGLALKLDSTLM
jgi:hypothetical protein